MPWRPSSHHNKFGALRLFFAACVLISHSFELIDGNRTHEPLTALFGTLSLGEFGVDGFFLVSGYLIAKSFEQSSSSSSFLWKRVLRIYPAFTAAFFVCLLVVAPLAGASLSNLSASVWAEQILRCLLLHPPQVPGVFNGLNYPKLNGSMWTIPTEFFCYLLVFAFGGWFFRFKNVFALFVMALLALITLLINHQTFWPGSIPESLRLVATFLCGSCFYAYRNEFEFKPRFAIVAIMLLIFAMFNLKSATFAIPTLGAYCLFCLSLSPTASWLDRINSENDISYGVYLYAWPIQNLIIKFFPGVSAFQVLILAAVGACSWGWISWLIIERPFLLLKSKLWLRKVRPKSDSSDCDFVTVNESHPSRRSAKLAG
jgi:peptidoglycan/LPS O-acetylase OafA/YrhL